MKPKTILLVEDNPSDIELTQRALARSHVANMLVVAEDGQEALEVFRANLPAEDGMAFVIVQHLDPTYKGMMVELLQQRADMQLFQTKDRKRVDANCAYVIPAQPGSVHPGRAVPADRRIHPLGLARSCRNILWKS